MMHGQTQIKFKILYNIISTILIIFGGISFRNKMVDFLPKATIISFLNHTFFQYLN
jgi:N-acetylmuramic acid 6-phosphate (MurNAc-6-P) etherase